MCFIFTVTKYEPAVEGIVDLWSPLLVPETVNIFKMHHQTVHIYLRHKRFETNTVNNKDESSIIWVTFPAYAQRLNEEMAAQQRQREFTQNILN